VDAIASASDLKLVRNVRRIGKKIAMATVQASAVVNVLRAVEALRNMAQASRFLPIIRIRKIATMSARMMAMMPRAEPPPTSYCSRDCEWTR
jgi:hypothetical protein